MLRPKRASRKQANETAPKRLAKKVAKPAKRKPQASQARRITGTVWFVGAMYNESDDQTSRFLIEAQSAAAKVVHVPFKKQI